MSGQSVRRLARVCGVWSECAESGQSVRSLARVCGVWSECAESGQSVRCLARVCGVWPECAESGQSVRCLAICNCHKVRPVVCQEGSLSHYAAGDHWNQRRTDALRGV